MMMKGMNPGQDTTASKIEEVIRLLREIGQSDPRIAPLHHHHQSHRGNHIWRHPFGLRYSRYWRRES
jgi:hypothetical protein